MSDELNQRAPGIFPTLHLPRDLQQHRSPVEYHPPFTTNHVLRRLLIFCIPVAEPDGSTSQKILEDLCQSTLPPEFRKEGGDWFATFNPKAKQVLDVSLVHTLDHKQ